MEEELPPVLEDSELFASAHETIAAAIAELDDEPAVSPLPDDEFDDEEEKMSSSGERGGDDPHVLQSLKGGHRNNGITSLAFAPNSRKYIFSSSTGDGSIMFWHVGGNASSSSKNRKRPVRFLGHEKDVLTLAHTQREGEGGRVASGGLDRSARVWKATA